MTVTIDARSTNDFLYADRVIADADVSGAPAHSHVEETMSRVQPEPDALKGQTA